MSEYYQTRRTSIADSAGFLGFVIGFIGAAPFAWSSLTDRWDNGDLTSGLLRFLVIILGAAAIGGVTGMGVGSAVGWLWERVHRSRRPARHDEEEDASLARPVAPRASAAATAPAVDVGPKTLIIIFGPPASGKMTVGEALARRTGLRLFHNHLATEPVLRFFEFGSPPYTRLVTEFRTRMFEEVAASPLPGMIYTLVWRFDDDADTRYVERVSAIFRARGADVYLVELDATQAERLRRNETEHRLAAKESRRDVAASRRQLVDLDTKWRLNSRDEFDGRSDYLRVENTDLSAEDVAERIVQRFGLREVPAMEPA